MSLRLTARLAAVACAVTILAMMAGCSTTGSAAEAQPSPKPTASGAPSPSAPGDRIAATDAITVAVDVLVVRSDDGTLVADFDYYADEAAPVITALTTAFGRAATLEEIPGSQETLPATRHVWGAFTLVELHYRDAEQRSGFVPTRAPAFTVELSGESSNGIEFASGDGRTVGEPWTEIESQPSFRIAGECAHAYTESLELEVVWYDGSPKTERLVVDLVPNDDATALAEVHAPVVETGCV